jgi:hypothetical protein
MLGHRARRQSEELDDLAYAQLAVPVQRCNDADAVLVGQGICDCKKRSHSSPLFRQMTK